MVLESALRYCNDAALAKRWQEVPGASRVIWQYREGESGKRPMGCKPHKEGPVAQATEPAERTPGRGVHTRMERGCLGGAQGA